MLPFQAKQIIHTYHHNLSFSIFHVDFHIFINLKISGIAMTRSLYGINAILSVNVTSSYMFDFVPKSLFAAFFREIFIDDDRIRIIGVGMDQCGNIRGEWLISQNNSLSSIPSLAFRPLITVITTFISSGVRFLDASNRILWPGLSFSSCASLAVSGSK